MQKVFPGLMALLMACTLPACRNSPAASLPAQAGPASSSAVGSAAEPAAQPDASAAYCVASSAPIHMLTSPYGMELSGGTQTDAGFYRTIQTNERSESIVYLDFSAKAMVYLCGQPNCPHTDDSCSAWLGEDPDWLAADEDKLYLIGSSVLLQADLDGKNRKTIYTTESDKDFFFGGMASNGRELFFVVEHITGENQRFTLSAFDTEQNVLREIKTFDQPVWIFAAREHDLLLQETAFSEEDETEKSILTRYGLDTQEEEVLREWNAAASVRADDTYLVAIDQEENCVEVSPLFESAEPKIYAPGLLKEDAFPRIITVRDHHALIAVYFVGTGEKEYWSIDLESGAVTHQVPPAQVLFGDTEAAEIVAAAGDRYLVRSGIQETTIPIHMADGSLASNETQLAQYAMIRKEDYWAGQSNYDPIANNLF